LVKNNIVVSKKEISGILKLSTLSSNGLSHIKDVLSDVESCKNGFVSYLGGGSYKVSCSGLSFKESDKALSVAIQNSEKKAKKLGVSFEFKRNEK
jgi:translation initiation factor 2 alpha subunit (eIF-2alpha)